MYPGLQPYVPGPATLCVRVAASTGSWSCMGEKGRPSRGGSPSRPHSPTRADGEASRRARNRCSQSGCTPAAHHGCTPYATRQSTWRLRRAAPEAAVASQSSSLVLTTHRLRTIEDSSGFRQWQCVSKRSGSTNAAAAALSGATDAVDVGGAGTVRGVRGGFIGAAAAAAAARRSGGGAGLPAGGHQRTCVDYHRERTTSKCYVP